VALFYRKEMLYSDDQKLMPRFINPALLNFIWKLIMNQGQVGGWIGWQIVRSYMKTMKYLCNN
jgi:hypothetical protein